MMKQIFLVLGGMLLVFVSCDKDAATDVVPPVIDIQSPLAGSNNAAGEVNLQIEMSDNVALASYDVFLYSYLPGDTVEVQRSRTFSPGKSYLFSEAIFLSRPGVYQLSVRIKDKADLETAKAISFQVSP
jgi:hypothetical protein